MTDGQLQGARVAASFAALVIAVIFQRVAPHARLRGSWRTNGGLWFLDTLVVGALCGGCAFAVARWAAEARLGVLNQAGVGTWWGTVPVTVLVLDLIAYVWHRANHAVPVLWRLHRVHHSDATFTVSTALRFHPGELVLALPVRLAAIVLLGAPAGAVLIFEAVFTLANLVEHGDINVPGRAERALGRVLITPALHRRHHTKAGPARDSNFGTIFVVWDRLFGTCRSSDSATHVETGLPDVPTDITLWRLLLLPLGAPQDGDWVQRSSGGRAGAC